ncbi:MAG: F0F1 ATP synthase subunit alpha, partial [Candidatus Riesia sp.]|nr:F0F1 ATP synthase subunit alpha [Candidatus Riesia sp.]
MSKISLKASEISDLIRERIEKFDSGIITKNEGKIVSLADGIVRIHGLSDVQYGERIAFASGDFGIALNLERDSVGAVVLGDSNRLAEGQVVRCTGEVLSVPVGPELLG